MVSNEWKERDFSMINGKRWLMAAGLALSVVLGGSFAQAAPTDEAKAQFCQESLSLVDYDKGQLSIVADIKSMVNCHYESEFYFSAKPQMAGKGTVTMTLVAPNQPASLESEYYLQENGEELVVYFKNPDSSWSKSAMKMSADQKKLYLENNKELIQASLDTVKTVEFGAKAGDKQSYVVTVDGEKIMPYFAKVMSLAGRDQESMLAMLRPVFENMGDYTYTVEIDRARHIVTGMQMDLSAPMRKVAMAGIDLSKCSPEQVKQIKDIVNNSTLTITINSEPLAKVPDLKVPKQVVRTAKPVEVDKVTGQQAGEKAASK